MYWKGTTMKKIKFESLLFVALLVTPGVILAQPVANAPKGDEIVVNDSVVRLQTTEPIFGLNTKIEEMPTVVSPDFFRLQFDNPFFCGKDDKYGDLETILKTGECFDAKLSRTQGKDEGFLVSEELLLKGDEQVCNCLKTDNNSKIVERMNLTHKDQLLAGNKKIEESINKNLKSLKGSIESLRDSMLFQADLLFRDSRRPTTENPEEINKVVAFYSGGFVTSSFNEGPARQLVNGLSSHLVDASKIQHGRQTFLGDHFSSVAGVKKEANAELQKSIDQALQRTKIDPPNIALISQPEFKEGQCIGPKEFLAKNQLPSDNEFYLALADEKFDERNWNYDVLEEKLIELTKDKNKNAQAIAGLQRRMTYLNRNPFIKHFFAASDDYEDYMKDLSGDSAETKKKFTSTPSKFIKDKKAELFKIIKANLTPSDKSCGQKPSGCKAAVAKESYARFKALSDNFFRDEKVGLFTNAQAKRSMFNEIEKFKSDPLSVADEIVPYTQEAIEKYVLDNTNFNPATCHNRNPASEGYNFDLVSCIDAYGLYCSTMAIAKENAAKGIVDNRYLAKQLTKDTQSFFSPDIEQNHELRKFNEEFCNTPRTAKDGSGKKSFTEFKEDYCLKNRGDAACSKSSFDNIAKLREMYRQNYMLNRNEGTESGRASVAAQELFDTWNMGIQDTSHNVANAAANERNVEFPSTLEQFFNDFNGTDFASADDKQKYEEAGMFNNLANVVSETNLKPSTSTFNSYDDISAYSNMASFTQAAVEETKIESLSTTQKEEILGQWRDELSEFKRENRESSNYDVSGEAQLKAKIEALETLLTQQQKLTADQYKLLNTAISNRQAIEAPKAVASTTAQNTEKETMEKVRVRSSSGFTTTALASGTLSDDSARSPASIKDNQGNSSSNIGSASAQRASTSSGARASADSVAREEAKLVNLRRFPDGSITIESAAKGGQVAPNAITVPVSDEQYRLLQSNPSALSLSQIEKSIPKEQLAELEKSGQIILVLQNGENPPFEVKVEKKDNKLVYQLQDPQGNKVNPVQRVYTRQALELELKVQ